jgi:plasmid maintenance system antidote protein VapI
MKRGLNKKISTFCQITPQHLSDILSRRKKPSAKLAVILEKYTSISRTIWIWGSREELREALETAFREPLQEDILKETSEL